MLKDAYYVAITDDTDNYRFVLAPDAIGKVSKILVESQGYQNRRLDVFDQLPEEITLDTIILPRPAAFEIGDYIRAVSPIGIPLQSSSSDASAIKITLAEGRLLQVIAGPEQQKERKWWKVRVVDENNQSGWIIASSATETYVEQLPLVVPGIDLK